ncbi:hypothetical protein L6452_10753 [Arctium lappa]|uniref:Uncharacterized protein n=1 Tax=Arctium lappa TaxID=4217 RepID=A0ACB9DNB5_ARCLA|nr:hypothetical protein L6452_10753 [Arctium lappa]
MITSKGSRRFYRVERHTFFRSLTTPPNPANRLFPKVIGASTIILTTTQLFLFQILSTIDLPLPKISS